MQLIEAAQQPILRIDARTKFALLFGVGISSLMFPPLWLEATTFVLMALLLTLNRRIKTSAKFTAAFLIMLLLDWTLSLKVSGGFAALFFSLVRLGRLMLPIFMAGILLMKTTSVSEFMLSFERMHLPNKLIIPLSVMFRFIPTISEEWQYPGRHAFSGDWHFCAFCADKANDDAGIYDGAAADVNRYDF